MLTSEDGAAAESKSNAGGAVGRQRWRQHAHSCSGAQHRVSATCGDGDGNAGCSGIPGGQVDTQGEPQNASPKYLSLPTRDRQATHVEGRSALSASGGSSPAAQHWGPTRCHLVRSGFPAIPAHMSAPARNALGPNATPDITVVNMWHYKRTRRIMQLLA